MASGEAAMAYSRGAVERAMKVQEVILRAIDGKLTWIPAADPVAQAGPGRRRAAAARALSRALSGVQRPAFPPTRAAPAWRALLLCVREESPARRRPRRQAPAPRPASAAPRAARLLR